MTSIISRPTRGGTKFQEFFRRRPTLSLSLSLSLSCHYHCHCLCHCHCHCRCPYYCHCYCHCHCQKWENGMVVFWHIAEIIIYLDRGFAWNFEAHLLFVHNSRWGSKIQGGLFWNVPPQAPKVPRSLPFGCNTDPFWVQSLVWAKIFICSVGSNPCVSSHLQSSRALRISCPALWIWLERMFVSQDLGIEPKWRYEEFGLSCFWCRRTTVSVWQTYAHIGDTIFINNSGFWIKINKKIISTVQNQFLLIPHLVQILLETYGPKFGS